MKPSSNQIKNKSTVYGDTLTEALNSIQSVIVGAPVEGLMLKSVYDSDNNGVVDYASQAGSIEWVDVNSKPSTFTPSIHNHSISEITNLQTQLNAKAPLNSPSFTGTPLVPTAPYGTNTTQMASTAFVQEAIDYSIIKSLPSIRPSLLLDFANSKQVDPRISFTRASTATYFDAQGVLRTAASGVPRIDHDPVTGECKGLLIEEARTNLLTYSEQFDNAAWGKSSASVSANGATAPDGALTADKLVEGASTAAHYVYASATSTTNANAYTKSVYAKAGERSLVNLFVVEGSTFTRSVQCTFNLATGVAGAVSLGGGTTGSASIQNVGGGWYRCSVTATLGGTDTSIQSRIRLTDASGNASYTGDGSSGLYIWGAQLEAGSFPTSYIPTTTAAATRAADVASMSGTNFSEWFNPLEGTFVVGFDAPNIPSDTATYGRVYSAHGGTNANSIDVLINGGWNPDRIVAIINVGGVASFDSAGTANGWVATPVAYAVNATAYKAGSFATSWNGLAAATDSAGALPVVNQLNIGCYLSASQVNGHISRIAYYPKRLTNAELQAITA